MNFFKTLAPGILLALTQVPAQADNTELFSLSTTNSSEYLQLAETNAQERRQERGRSDERQDRRDCRQEEGRVGKDKRDCKQEEVRDGIRGNRKKGDS